MRRPRRRRVPFEPEQRGPRVNDRIRAPRVLVIDETGRIETFNKAATEMFGYSAAEILGKPVSTLMPEPHHSQHDHYMNRYLTTGEARIIGIGRDLEAVDRDGNRIPIHLSVSEVQSESGRRFTGIIRDLSEQQAARQAPIELPTRCTGPWSCGAMRSRMTRSSWLRTNHLAPPDAPASVPIRSAENPCRRTLSNASGPALNTRLLLANRQLAHGVRGSALYNRIGPDRTASDQIRRCSQQAISKGSQR